jgi:hypothetical protein
VFHYIFTVTLLVGTITYYTQASDLGWSPVETEESIRDMLYTNSASGDEAEQQPGVLVRSISLPVPSTTSKPHFQSPKASYGTVNPSSNLLRICPNY